MNVGKFHSDMIRNKIEALWAQNCSLREIARQLDMSRNAVGGLIRRMNLPARDLVPRSQKPRGWTAHKLNGPKPKAPDPIGPIGDFPGAHACRHISGPITVDFQCCGHAGFPFCEYHSKRCYQAAKVAA